MGKTVRIILSNERIKGLAKSYHTTQKMIRKLVDQFGYSALFDIALNKHIQERV